MAASVPLRSNLPRVIFGLAIVAAGVLFTLDNLHVVRVENYLDYWPIALILFGLAHLAQSGTWGGRVWGAVIAFAGVWILGENLGYVSASVWSLSPLLLVALGASIIWRACCGPAARVEAAVVGSSAALPARDKRFIRGTVVMGAFESGSDAVDFRGGDLVAIMAGFKIDLRRASIAGPEAVIDVQVVMGGVELRIPDTWAIESRVVPVLGAVNNRARTASGESAQRLVLRGNVFMGEVEIKN